MNKGKRILWMNLMLVFALVAGLIFPASNVSAAGKQKKETKKCWLYISQQQEQQKTLQKR